MYAIHHRYTDIDGQHLFYREAGAAGVPAVALMYGVLEVHLDGTRPRLEPDQTMIPHGPDFDLSMGAVWADAIFVSGLQRCDEPSAGQVRQAVAGVIQAFGCSGCAGRVAQEFGDHPETAVSRMRWARAVAREALADPAPSGSPRAGRRQPTRSATGGEG